MSRRIQSRSQRRKRVRRTASSAFDVAAEAARQVNRRFGPFDPATAEAIVRTFKATLVPRRRSGRKADAATVRAAEIYREGIREFRRGPSQSLTKFERRLWERIYAEVMPDAMAMPLKGGQRMLTTAPLRRKVAAYLARRKEPTLATIARRARRSKKRTRTNK